MLFQIRMILLELQMVEVFILVVDHLQILTQIKTLMLMNIPEDLLHIVQD